MKSLEHGKNISKPEVTNISEHGFWLFIDEKEYFLPFKSYPWFVDATVAQITNIELSHKNHLYWRELDIDLSINVIKNPEKYPLIAKK